MHTLIGTPPVRTTKTGRPRKSKYPFYSTPAGGHFTVPIAAHVTTTTMKSRINALAHIHLGRGNYQIQVTPKGIRVWRMR